MAPIVESTVDSLKDTIHKLEKRVWELENKLEGRAPNSTNVSDQMRMILIGPPGAGPSSALRQPVPMLTFAYRQRYSGSEHQGQVLRLSPSTSIYVQLLSSLH